ncbi:Myb-related protein B [Termitomyces sp. J132]|nr:Myb-related protein B [Termitomyces sp. J132]
MLCRERRSWTAKEDQLLRDAVAKEDPDNPNPSKWHAIAKHVPNRTNKDCRKRWFAKMASDVVKGGWAPDEDEKLVKGIEKYGTRWSLVASVVQTRNSDQCAKRWTDTLNPAIDRTTWTAEADEILLQAVSEHGKVWTKIVKTYFPGRTGLSAKNRYNSITRFNADRGARSRRKTPDLLPYLSHRKSESVSSSSSSVSPSTPSLTISDGSHSPFSSAIDSVPETYLFDTFSNWTPTSSPLETTSEGLSFFSSGNRDVFNVKEEALPTPLLTIPPHQSFNSSLSPVLMLHHATFFIMVNIRTMDLASIQ